ncbi:MAG: family 43 glycosylhydrolase [Alphaproteobacteria bacterium]
MAHIQNPILNGFHPDPSICKGHDGAWYIATSTFEWLPGVLIYRSEDLQNWKLVAAPVNSHKFIDCTGIPSSGGIWAPSLTYQAGQYFLVYSNLLTWKSDTGKGQSFKDAINYVTWADDVTGEWAKPVSCGGGGFDPSFFADDDNRLWYVWMWWDWRSPAFRFDKEVTDPTGCFGGIYLQEFDKEKGLIGKAERIFTNTHVGLTEGPHIFKKDGYYYLLVAEGGTSWEHAESIARSRNLHGPYELHPQTPLMTSIDRPDWPLQKTGHASMCAGPDDAGDDLWIMAHLTGRPLTQRGACPLGRETAIQPIEWKDGWPWIKGGGRLGLAEWQTDYLDDVPPASHQQFFDFTTLKEWPLNLASLRDHKSDDWCQLSDEGLKLLGRHSPHSKRHQSVVGIRVQDFAFVAETEVQFTSHNHQQFAGLSLRYDEANQYQLLLLKNHADTPTSLSIAGFVGGELIMPLGDDAPHIDESLSVQLRLKVKHGYVYFAYKQDGDWIDLGVKLNWSPLSDEGAMPMGFTGNFVCLVCHDMLQSGNWASFKYLNYQPL